VWLSLKLQGATSLISMVWGWVLGPKLIGLPPQGREISVFNLNSQSSLADKFSFISNVCQVLVVQPQS